MPLKNFLYYLLEDDGRSLYVQNGVVSTSGTKRPLIYTPSGWEEIAVAWERVMKYYGLNRNFSVPLGFYNDGAFILRHEFYTRNIERKIFLLIQQLGLEYTASYYKWLYSYLYKGELDFSTFKSERDKVTISINEGGLTRQFKANENTVYAFPMDEDPDVKYLYMDGIFLSEKHNFISQSVFLNPPASGRHLPGLLFINKEGAAAGVATFTVYANANIPSDYANSTEYFLATSQVITGIRIHGSLKFSGIGTGNYALNLMTNQGRTISLGSQATATGINTFVFDETFDSQENEQFFFEADYDAVVNEIDYIETDIKVEFTSRYKGTTIKFFHPFDLYKKLVGKITSDENNAQSTLLQTNSDYAVTCGDAIRGLSGVSIRTSLSAFFKDYDTTLFAGLSIDNGKIKMEDRATFFDASNPINLGNIKNHEINYAADLAGSTVKVGHTKPEIEDINGRFDPNGSSIFTLPITRVAREIDLVGPYKKGPYEIEITRINLDGKTTTDNNNDNDCFVIHVKAVDPVVATVSFAGQIMTAPLGIDFKVGMRIEIQGSAAGNDANYTIEEVVVGGSSQDITLNEAVVTEAGVSVTIIFPYILNRDAVVDSDPDVCPSPETIFNVILTPKNILNKHKRWLASVCTGFDAEKIRFQSGEKNTRFLATVNGNVIDEDADVDIITMGPRLFLNYYHDIETLIPIDLVELLEANPNRCFKFTDVDLNQEFTGFNIKAGIAPNKESPQQLRLLSAPTNDLTKLIY